MNLKNTHIAIVGGGPGGLTLARLLQMQGAIVQVYERDLNRSARLTGSPLDMHETSGLAALRAAGLLEAFKAAFRPGADKTVLTNRQAEVVYSDHAVASAAFGNAHFRPEIDRGPLRDLLLNSLLPQTVVWDRHFTAMQPQDSGWQLQFKNGATAYADLVVAADGANSKIRPYVTGITPFYTGITMLEGRIPDAASAVPHFHQLLDGGKIMAFGDAKCILGGQKGNGELGFYLSLKKPEDWAATNGINYADPIQLQAWFQEEYAGWSPLWQQLFGRDSAPLIPRLIYCMPLRQSWETRSNVTLLGDAAHVMPPFAGEGANMAMLDALELSSALASDSHHSLEEALSFYEESMRERGALAAGESLENGERMHAADSLDTMLRFFGLHTV